MPNAAIDSQLVKLVNSLGELRIALLVSDPNYDTIEKQYRDASDRLSEAIGKEIDSADQDYQDFSEGVTAAIVALKEARKKLEKVAKAVKLAAKALDIAGKVAKKLV